MRHSRTGRAIAISAGACLLLALGCGLLSLAVERRVFTLGSANVQVGPLVLITRAPRSSICPLKSDPVANICERFSANPGPAVYHIWIFVSTRERGAPSMELLAHWAIPQRSDARD